MMNVASNKINVTRRCLSPSVSKSILNDKFHKRFVKNYRFFNNGRCNTIEYIDITCDGLIDNRTQEFKKSISLMSFKFINLY